MQNIYYVQSFWGLSDQSRSTLVVVFVTSYTIHNLIGDRMPCVILDKRKLDSYPT